MSIATTFAVSFTSVIPVLLMEGAAVVVLMTMIGGFVYKYVKWRKLIPPSFMDGVWRLGFKTILKILGKTLLLDLALQFELYYSARARWVAHLLMFWGFIGAAVTTTLLAIFNPSATPLHLTHPITVLGTVSGIMMVTGGTYAAVIRVAKMTVRTYTTFHDSLFLGLFYAVSITGFQTQYVRHVLNDPSVAIPIYTIHLFLIALLFALAPFTKFMHALTRPTLAMIRRLESELLQRGVSVQPVIPTEASR